MSIVQAVLEKLQALPPDKQQEILDFTEFLYQKCNAASGGQAPNSAVPNLSLGQRLRSLRAEIVASGEPLLTAEEISQEIAEQRDRLHDLEP